MNWPFAPIPNQRKEDEKSKTTGKKYGDLMKDAQIKKEYHEKFKK